jgi:hypothetical protein
MFLFSFFPEDLFFFLKKHVQFNVISIFSLIFNKFSKSYNLILIQSCGIFITITDIINIYIQFILTFVVSKKGLITLTMISSVYSIKKKKKFKTLTA